MNPRLKPLAALLPLVFAAQSSFASETQTTLDNLVVTATRTPQSADDSIQSITVITRQDIEQSGARDIMGLLDGQAGINVARSGGLGKATSIYMRGSESKHTLVLVDGVRAASGTLGEYDWNALSPEQIERIEIVRGPRASIYGSDAIGGVIQIFTRKENGPSVSLRGGSYGTEGASVGFGGGDLWRYSVSAGYDRTNGIRTYKTDTARRGYEREYLGGGLQGSLSDSLSVALRANQSWSRNQMDPSTGNDESTNRTVSARFDHKINSIWKQSLTLGEQLDQTETFSPNTPATIRTDRNSFSWQHDIAILGGLTSAGVDHWNDHITKDRSGAIDQKIENTGVFLQHQFESLGSDWQLALRNDRHDTFGSHNTWNIGWGNNLNHLFRLTASYGTAFKAPTGNSLFWPYSSDTYFPYSVGSTYYQDTYIFQGNTGLRPETARTAEFGIRFQSPEFKGALNAYESRLKNLIDWTSTYTANGGTGTAADPYRSTYTYFPDNVDAARIRGLELTGSTDIASWQVRGGYTRLLATNLETGKQLDRRPQNTFILKAMRSFGAHRISLESEAYSGRLDYNGARKLSGYGLAHVGYEYRYSQSISLGGRIENLFDKDYSTARTATRYYDAPGRSVFLTLRYAPK